MFHLDQMVSIKLFDFNEDQLDILKGLYKRHLRKDDKWHFFWEGYYTLIRCQKLFAPKVKGYLRYHKVQFVDQGVWVDNISITKKYQEEFQQIFHGYSVLAMKGKDEEVDKLIDRVIHCFLNNMSTNERRKGDYTFWEPYKIIDNALQRAVFIGQIIERSKQYERQSSKGKSN